jgi:hypothetical protein
MKSAIATFVNIPNANTNAIVIVFFILLPLKNMFVLSNAPYAHFQQ